MSIFVKTSPGNFRTLLWITFFGIAMGYFESAAVIYLRNILYQPATELFPLVPISTHLAITELIREAATLVMLIGVGIIAGRTNSERFAWFIYTFAVWDIFYYIFLKLLIGWPASLLTWDILFLLPVTWTGPVISPVIVSFSMIFLALTIVYFTNFNINTKISLRVWIFLSIGAFIVFLAFIWDYSRYILHFFTLRELWSVPSSKALFDLSQQYVPVSFNWGLFSIGMIIILFSTLLFIKEQNNINK
ncbi:MAG TPA: hypothetical protein VE912_12090 [Bacteroidales bacterium]|nr:hypothetical protein [Bacteroidales bacterium]